MPIYLCKIHAKMPKCRKVAQLPTSYLSDSMTLYQNEKQITSTYTYFHLIIAILMFIDTRITYQNDNIIHLENMSSEHYAQKT